MTAFDFKILAFTFMFIDHIGRVFMDGSPVMLGLGRLSFPLFAWLAAQGEAHTSNLRNYLFRLLAIGLVTQPFYHEVWRSLFTSAAPWNILFTLAFGVLLLRTIRAFEHRWIKGIIFLLLAIVGEALHLEGGFVCVATIGIMAQFKPQQNWGNALWYGALVGLQLLDIALFHNDAIEFCGLAAPWLLLWYNGHQGPNVKWLYLIYPLHFVAILAVKQYLLPLILVKP